MTSIEIITEAIRRTSDSYGANGDHDSDLIANALDRLLFWLDIVIKETNADD